MDDNPDHDSTGIAGFRGFRSPGYTQVPNELFDLLLPFLSGAELKVLLYIIRRREDSAQLSLSRMLCGTRQKDGTLLDPGVCLSRGAFLQALRRLAEPRQKKRANSLPPQHWTLTGGYKG